MKRLIGKTLLCLTLLVTVQSAQAAWIVSLSTVGSRSPFAREVYNISWRVGVTAGIAGFFTGLPVFSAIFILGDEKSEAIVREDLEKRYPELKNNEVLSELSQLALNPQTNGTLIGNIEVEGQASQQYKIQLTQEEVTNLALKHGLSDKMTEKLITDLTTNL